MCGFAGFCDAKGRFYTKGKETVRKMTDRILHRGPDSRGEYSDEFFSVGFTKSITALPIPISDLQRARSMR